ncbi:MAG: DeoR/GlpR family DNA-binding transcription regulator [Spirochaetia bacterium]|nr:DeoR/GlpR family DNA-binding transcription regulator [Spirochaetia bacterium]
MKNKSKRLEALKTMLRIEISMRISEISKRMGVSPMTTRRDIEILSNQGIVKVLHGAVVYKQTASTSSLSDYTLTVAENQNIDKKKEIGRYAASFIEENDVVFLDAGSTTEFLAQFLPTEYPFTVICYAINIFLAVAGHKNINVILSGGIYDRKTTILHPSNCCEILKNNRTHKAFISAGGLHSKLGVTCANQGECDMKKAAIRSTVESYLLIDSTKFYNVLACFFANPESFSHIITNSDVPEDYVQLLKEKKISTHFV